LSVLKRNDFPAKKGDGKMSEHDDFGSFLVGFVVGGLTGAVVALLFAPQSGEETRTVIKEKSFELRDKASQTAEDALARAEAAAADAKVRYDQLAAEVKSRSQEVIASAKKAVAKKKPVEPAAN
jgi:gas vesicle protein